MNVRIQYKYYIERCDSKIRRFTNKLASLNEDENASKQVVKTTIKKLSIFQQARNIDYYTYRKILLAATSKLRDILIKEGETVSLTQKLGYFRIYRKSVKARINESGQANFCINWKQSNDRKQEILNRGGVPYDKNNTPHGEKYLVYITEGDVPRLVWNHSKWVSGTGYWFISPSSGTNGFVRKLFAFVNEQEENILLYKRHRNESYK